MKTKILGMLFALSASSIYASNLNDNPIRDFNKPIFISAQWSGSNCNDRGELNVTITNISKSPIYFPKNVLLGYGGLFIERMKFDNNILSTFGDHYMTPYTDDNFADPNIIEILPNGNHIYHIILNDRADSFDNFSRNYGIHRNKMELNFIYVLHHDGHAKYDFYFVSKDLYPVIKSNTLACGKS